MTTLCIIDYGAGNLKSIKRGLEKVGAKVEITHSIKIMQNADGIILPGVGAFGDAMKNLSPIKKDLIEQIKQGKPFLGVCLGYQLLFSESTEGGIHTGLDILKGRVVKLPNDVKIPHMGWNTLKIIQKNISLVEDIKDDAYVYFVHSYYPKVLKNDFIIATTNYGVEFASIIAKEHIFATQFHPEKSGKTGLKILDNFVKLVKGI